MPAAQTFPGTISRLTCRTAEVVYDVPNGEVNADGFSGAEMVLTYADLPEDTVLPFTVGDAVKIVVTKVKDAEALDPNDYRPIATNVTAHTRWSRRLRW